MLTQQMLLGYGAVVTPPSIALVQHGGVNVTEQTNDATVHTFTNHSIGAADATRRVVVVAISSDSATGLTFTGITIGGNAATIHAQGTSATSQVAIASLLVAAGTTATIVCTKTGGTPDRNAIIVYRAINETSATPHATLVDNAVASGVYTGTINIPTNGWVVGAVMAAASVSPVDWTWVGLTKEYDQVAGDAAGRPFSGGSQSGMTLEANRTITATQNAGTDGASGRMCAVSWG